MKEKFFQAKNDIENGLSLTSTCDKNGINYRTMKKLLDFNQLELDKYFEDKQLKLRMKRINEKMK